MSRQRRAKPLFIVLATVLLLIVVAFVCIAGSISSYAKLDQTQTADAAIVLGAAVWGDEPSPVFAERINHSIILYEQGYVGKIIFTGGAGEGSNLSEAAVARDYALAHGVAAADIYIEESSTITAENLENAAPIITAAGFGRVLIVSDPLHMKRAMLMASDSGLDAYSSPTRTSKYQSLQSKLPFLARETFYYIGYLFVRVF